MKRKRSRFLISVACLTATTVVLVALMASSCGSSSSAPATPAPAPTPAPTPEPTPTPPPETTPNTLQVDLIFVLDPTNEFGYVFGETVLIEVRWDGFLEVSGNPRLRLKIGDDIRWARYHLIYTSRLGDRSVLRFLYEVRDDDYDEDGFSIAADALDLNGGSIIAADGSAEVDLDLGEHAIDNLTSAKVNVPGELTVRDLTVAGAPANPPLGYLDGESIHIRINFSGWIEVIDWPKLRVEIGEEERYAVFDSVHEGWVNFIYRVRYDDHDSDGIGIPADAIELNEGRIVSYVAQDDVDPNLRGHARENWRTHRVRATTPSPDIRDCSIEQREVRRHRAGWIVDEWDGTPFRVDIIRNFPSFVSDDDLEELLDPIGIMADDIEEHLGYRILEKGELIPVPAGAPDGWNTDYYRYSDDPSMLPRERGQLLAFYMDDDTSFWDHRGGAPMIAFPEAGTTSYNRRTMGKWWNDQDTCCVHRYNGNGRHGHTLVHEVAHLLGFEHPNVPFGTPGVRMAWGSTSYPWLSGSRVHHFAPKDIEVLKCLFPRR